MAFLLAEPPKVLAATGVLIDEFFKMTPAPGDRVLSATRMKMLNKEVDEGRFRPPVWASAECLENGVTYRVNGKHTSTLLATLNGRTPKDQKVFVERYLCDTLEDVAALYATYDMTITGRSTGDINRSVFKTIPELVDVKDNVINICVTAIDFEEYEGSSPLSPYERALKLHQHIPFVLWVAELFHGDHKGYMHLRRSPVVSAMVRTYHKSRNASDEFWKEIRDGGSPAKSVPAKLREYLLVNRIRASRGESATPREMYVKCLHAWNAWRKGTSTGMKYFPEADTPKVV